MYRILRGGGWDGNATYCRSADRYRYLPDYRDYGGGFRIIIVRNKNG